MKEDDFKQDDFTDFIKSSTNTAPELDDKVLNTVKSGHNSDSIEVSIKIFFVHLFAGISTLIFCPQFGWNPLGVSDKLAHIFMEYGLWACGAFCGFLFIGFGSIITRAIIPKHQLSLFRKRFIANSILINGFFISSLMLLGNVATTHSYYTSFSFILGWIVSAVICEYIFMCLNIKLKYNNSL
jgi:hypothetical protein